MIPYDGSGYGVSIYWRSQMKDIADESGEACACWKNEEPTINFLDGENISIKIECKEKTEKCKVDFNTTEIEFMKRFKEFYKV
jgi:hypothetical protein